jgi:hypothetical protein
MKKNVSLSFAICTLLVITNCKKKPSNTVETGSASIVLNHFWEDSVFQLGTIYRNTVTSDTFNFETFKYYLSNVQLKNTAGNWISLNDSYFLVDLSDTTTKKLVLKNVPKGNYTACSILFGIDSLHNISGAQTGVLSPTNGMFWSWNTGYIMLKMEGLSPNSSSNDFAFHVAGFEGPFSVLHRKEIDFDGAVLNVSTNHPKIVVDVAVNELWNNIPSLSISSFVQSVGLKSRDLAYSFTNSWYFKQLEN